jgi:hypothetical protein
LVGSVWPGMAVTVAALWTDLAKSRADRFGEIPTISASEGVLRVHTQSEITRGPVPHVALVAQIVPEPAALADGPNKIAPG